MTDIDRTTEGKPLDSATLIQGVDGPFEVWESDHTALVHVLWAAKRAGLTLDDADAVAERILQSRWAAAYRAPQPAPTTAADEPCDDCGRGETCMCGEPRHDL